MIQESAILINLIITIIIEFPVLLLGSQKPVRSGAVTCVLINLFTVPIGMIVYRDLLPNLVLVESGIVVVEAFLISWLLGIPYRRSFPLSLLANGVTAFLGFILYSSY